MSTSTSSLPPRPRRRDKSGVAEEKQSSHPHQSHSQHSSTSSHHQQQHPQQHHPQQHGGWSSINNQAGQPYTALGEPILDYVYQVKRKRGGAGGGNNNYGNNNSNNNKRNGYNNTLQNNGNGEEKEQQQQQADKNGGNGASGGESRNKSTTSNSLDVIDPVRDLLALCTPRRADIIDASAAIRERVSMSEARIRTVKAGGSFEEIDKCLKKRGEMEKWKKERGKKIQGIGEEKDRESMSAPSSSTSALPPSSATDPSFGSSLMQSAFLTLSKHLNDGSISITSAPTLLQSFAKQHLGKPFDTNWEGNLFQNLPAHPMMMEDEEEKPPQAVVESAIVGQDVNAEDGSLAATARTIPSLILPQPTPASTQRLSSSTHRKSDSHSSTSTAPSSSSSSYQRNVHAPPSSLSFHTLRYTLHQSFGIKHTAEMAEQAAAAAAAAAAATAAGSGKGEGRKEQGENGSSTDRTNNNTKNVPGRGGSGTFSSTSATTTTTPQATTRGRSRIRREVVLEDSMNNENKATSSATTSDLSYERAVANSKYRREHNNSPTSHWLRLQDMISQRTQQARALKNMAYFNPEGNSFMQGGMTTQTVKWGEKKKGGGAGGMNEDDGNGNASGQDRSASSSPISSHRNRINNNGGATDRSINKSSTTASSGGQILRQVANTSWDHFFVDQQTGGGVDKDGNPLSSSSSSSSSSKSRPPAAIENTITKRAELTLARCYADFDLAKKDLRERLYESLALMDTERSRVLEKKYLSFHPSFLSAEDDILNMRLSSEYQRYSVIGSRLHSLELLYKLIEFINQQNGGTNGPPGCGMTGYTYQAMLPTFEEIYFIEVLTCLIDSSIPMKYGEGGNVLGEVRRKQTYEEEKEVVVGKERKEEDHDGELRDEEDGRQKKNPYSLSSNNNNPSSSSQQTPQRRVSHILVNAGGGVTGGGVNGAFGATANSSTSQSHPSTSSSLNTIPISSSTPPPSFLLLLLCLSPVVLKCKEVRETLDKWSRLCGISEEATECALRMVGIDPRLSAYSGRGVSKGNGGGGAGANSAAAATPAQMLLLSEGALGSVLSNAGLDGTSANDGSAGGSSSSSSAATKAALLAAAAAASAASNPPSSMSSITTHVSRPLSSVILAPVALDDWESLKRSQRIKQSARDLARRVKAVRDLTTSSNAQTRIALGLSQRGAAAGGTGTNQGGGVSTNNQSAGQQQQPQFQPQQSSAPTTAASSSTVKDDPSSSRRAKPHLPKQLSALPEEAQAASGGEKRKQTK